ncbi:MAG: hypothetical protein WBG08_10250, partial [Litorimonas sp.]
MKLRRQFLSTAAIASVALFAAPALSAPTDILTGLTLPVGTPQTQGAADTTQLRFPDGTLIGFVGEADYSILDDGSIEVRSGNVTVLSGTSPFTVRYGDDTVEVTGGAALAVSGGQARSHVLNGSATVRSGGSERSYTSGEAWQSDGNGASQVVTA